MATETKPYYSEEEYLVAERAAEYKSEYYKGEILALAGASRRSGLIITNLSREMSSRLKERPCEAYASDMRVRIAPTSVYTYPDFVIVCGEPRFADDAMDTLLNPTVIFEVLSESTEAYDRGRKFEHYRTLDSLRDYILVSQERIHIDHFERQKDDRWLLTPVGGADEEFIIASIACSLKLSEVYDKVPFDGEAPAVS